MRIPGPLTALLLCIIPGCSSSPDPSPEEEVAEFARLEPSTPEFDFVDFKQQVTRSAPYRVIPGDLLKVIAQRALFSSSPDDLLAKEEVLVRVRDDGTIFLGILPDRPLPVVGKTLAQIGELIVETVYPDLVEIRPAVVIEVAEFRYASVSVFGEVQTQGIQRLKSNELTLYDVLTRAGGITGGARAIRIHRTTEEEELVFPLPVIGSSIPGTNMELMDGDVVEVLPLNPTELLTVVGLVKKPGAFEYPAHLTYNLLQALALAGGVDTLADPPYATVFREAPSGEIRSVTVEISGNQATRAASLRIHPGDIVAIDHTRASWTRSFLAQVVRLQFGAVYDPFDD